MGSVLEGIFSQYQGVATHLIVLELIGVFFGFLSVWYSKKEDILVFPTGIISTGIFVYILMVFGLLGDMLINGYYFSISIYGWWLWTRKGDQENVIEIARINKKEKKWSALLFAGAVVFVVVVYLIFNRWDTWTAYVDTFTTATFFVGMWLMARKKLENWIFWIIGDIISIPLYWYKGLIFTSFQYVLFTIIAVLGYFAWKKSLDKNHRTLLK